MPKSSAQVVMLFVPALALGAALAYSSESTVTAEFIGSRLEKNRVAAADDVIVVEKEKDYIFQTVPIVMVGAATSVTNAHDNSPVWVGGLGVVAGIFGIATGSNMLGDIEAPTPLAYGNLGIGILSTAFGLQALLRAPRGTQTIADTASSSAWRLMPWLEPQGRSGVLLNIRF